MLRYMLLAGAAAVAIPCAGLAQVQWSQPLPGENEASSVMNQGPGPSNTPEDYGPSVQPAGPPAANAGDYATGQRTSPAPLKSTSPTRATTPPPPRARSPATASTAASPRAATTSETRATSPWRAPTRAPPASRGRTAHRRKGLTAASPIRATAAATTPASRAPPSAYVGQGQGSSETTTAGQGLGGEGAYQQGQTTYGAYGNAPANQGYGGGYTGPRALRARRPSIRALRRRAATTRARKDSQPSRTRPSLRAPMAMRRPTRATAAAITPARRALRPSRTRPQPQGAYSNAPANQGYGGGYYTGQQGAYGGQSGYYTGQPNAGQVQAYPGQGGEA